MLWGQFDLRGCVFPSLALRSAVTSPTPPNPTDCFGVPNGPARFDAVGVCNGTTFRVPCGQLCAIASLSATAIVFCIGGCIVLVVCVAQVYLSYGQRPIPVAPPAVPRVYTRADADAAQALLSGGGSDGGGTELDPLGGPPPPSTRHPRGPRRRGYLPHVRGGRPGRLDRESKLE